MADTLERFGKSGQLGGALTRSRIKDPALFQDVTEIEDLHVLCQDSTILIPGS